MNAANIIRLVIIGIAAYAMGNINPSIILGKLKGIDIRKEGSGNAGMTNAIRVMGLKAGIIVFIVDVMKAFIAVRIGYNFGFEYGAMVAFAAVVLGHCFPAALGFKGGKGVLVGVSSFLIIDPKVFLALILIFIVILTCSKFVSLSSIMATAYGPLATFLISWIVDGDSLGRSFLYLLLSLPMAGVIIWMHRTNIERLRDGTESRFTFKFTGQK